MDEKILKWLFDIKMTIEEIEGYFEDKEKDFFQYHKNSMLKIQVFTSIKVQI